MKRNWLISIVLIVGPVLLLQLGCQQDTGRKMQDTERRLPQAGQALPKITLESMLYDFGEVAPGTSKSGEFKFTNTGQGTLEITNVKSCCGCTTSLGKKQYAPGENGVLKVSCHFAQRSGMFSRQLYINSNDKTNPQVALSVRAKIATKINYQPQRLSLLLNGENANCPDITITSLDNRPFSIKAFKSTADCITADIDSSVEATKFVLKPKVDPKKLQNNLNGFVEITLTHPDSPVINIAFSTLPRFKISTPVIIVFNALPQQPVKRDISVLSNYNEEFKIESTSSQNGFIKVLNQEKITNGYQLEVEITPPAAQSNKRFFTDVFTINIEGKEPLKITCRGFYASGQRPLPGHDTRRTDSTQQQ